MVTLRWFFLIFIVLAFSCQRSNAPAKGEFSQGEPITPTLSSSGRGALLLSNFKSLEELKEVIQIQYVGVSKDTSHTNNKKSHVRVSYRSEGKEVTSVLRQGVSEADFMEARKGNYLDKVRLLIRSPYAVFNRNDLERVEIMSRRRDHMFGEGDVAFYDLAETMVYQISDEDRILMSPEALSEKGYLNTFNHVVAQTFMTTLFSETLADFVADVHERSRLPELATGLFTMEQIRDIENGPVDNYLDIVNNECGQELGKGLSKKYVLNRNTNWTPELLANFMNDIQTYHSWSFQIAFKPFRPSDEIIIRFANKINRVIDDLAGLKKMQTAF